LKVILRLILRFFSLDVNICIASDYEYILNYELTFMVNLKVSH